MLLDRQGLPPLKDGTRQAAVVDSNIVTFPEGTSLEVKNAVGSWLLFAPASREREGSGSE